MGKSLPPHSPEAGSDPRARPSGMTQTLRFSEDRNECPLLVSLLEPSAFRTSLTSTVSGERLVCLVHKWLTSLNKGELRVTLLAPHDLDMS